MLGNDGASWTYDLRRTNWSSHDPYFAYTYFENFGVEGRWWPTWEITCQSCDVTPAYYTLGPDIINNTSSSSILFTTENSAPKVDLVAATANKTCPEELGLAINVTNNVLSVPTHVNWRGGDSCAMVASSTPTTTPDPCQVKNDSVIAASMSASLKATLCKGLHPPADCPEEDGSAAQKLVVIGVSCLLAAIEAFGFLLM
ncbi:uncharacterized protein KD926_008602 [Aspergillus affinis]|uniref:uncharacterized protein n=1 Tax=Aspergillus affinis TaxID=1070780 RepID=UPI0022FE8890|nr:uncharacterized protein KD926_008602 [Aspergillus affinis]KAI9040039.1 hypothetical protein KD926_008602 [Aspergillus affinis]